MQMMIVRLAAVAAVVLTVGCASSGRRGPTASSAQSVATQPMTRQPPPQVEPKDPLEPFNRVTFQINDKFYFWLLKPVSQGYAAVVPQNVRVGVSNMFGNLGAPGRIVNLALQNRSEEAYDEVGRFLANSTFGGLGYHDFDPPDKRMRAASPDTAQTLGHYGANRGWFVNWPLLGPSTVRGTVGMVGDWALDPSRFVDPWEVRAVARGTEIVNGTSLAIGRYEAVRNSGPDPYVAVRNGYLGRLEQQQQK